MSKAKARRRCGTDDGAIENIVKALLKKEEEAKSLMALKEPSSCQEIRIIELLSEMAQHKAFLEKKAPNGVNLSRYS